MTEPPQPPQPPPYPPSSGDPEQPFGPDGSNQPWEQPGARAARPWGQQGPPPTGYPQGGYPVDPAGQPQDAQPGPGPWGGPGYGPPPAAQPQNFKIDLGPRLRRRAEPRFGISLAATGIAIAVIGVLVWSFGYLIQGVHFDSGSGRISGDTRRFLGFGLSLLLVAAGYALVIVRRRGPLATAGVIGVAIGVPLALAFLTVDFSSPGSDGLPFNVDLIYLLSIIVYMASYLLVPGMRGRAFLLGLSALQLAGYAEFKTAGDAVARASTTVFGTSHSVGDLGTGGVTAVGLIFGLAYFALAVLLDRKGMHGGATALVVAGTYTTLAGVVFSVLTFKQVGTGVELIVLGTALSWYGAHFGRRFTTWLWMAAIAVGVGLVVQKALPDSPAGAGITLIVIGVAVVALAQLVATLTREAPEIDEGAPATTAVPVGAGPGRHR